jgi:hypothetical protein
MVQEFYDALAAGNDVDATIDRYMAEDYVEHEAIPGSAPPGTRRGRGSR